jgi:hypothetical protein
MTKLNEKYLQTYSIDTLRDSGVSSPTEGDLLRYTSGQWLNVQEPAFGKDAVYALENVPDPITGGAFQPYLVFNLIVPSGTPASNLYRINVDFLWSHNSASNDARFALNFNNGAIVKELRIEPKDQGGDQRYQNNILLYIEDLTAGTYPVSFEARPARASRITTLYEAIGEAWRTA